MTILKWMLEKTLLNMLVGLNWFGIVSLDEVMQPSSSIQAQYFLNTYVQRDLKCWRWFRNVIKKRDLKIRLAVACSLPLKVLINTQAQIFCVWSMCKMVFSSIDE